MIEAHPVKVRFQDQAIVSGEGDGNGLGQESFLQQGKLRSGRAKLSIPV